MKIFRISDFILAGSWLLAFVFSLTPLAHFSWSVPLAIGFMGVFLTTGLGRELAGPGIPAPRSAVFWLVPLIWLLGLASLGRAAGQSYSMVAFFTLGLLVFGFLVFATTRGLFRSLILIGPGVLLILTLFAGWALLRFMIWGDMPIRYDREAPLLLLALFPATAFALNATQRLFALLIGIAGFIMAAAIVVTSGGHAAIMAALGLAALAGLCWPRVAARWMHFAIIAAGLAAGAGLRLVKGIDLSRHDIPVDSLAFARQWAGMEFVVFTLLIALAAGVLWRMNRVISLRGAASGERLLCAALLIGVLTCIAVAVGTAVYPPPLLCLAGLSCGLWLRYTHLVLNDAEWSVHLPSAWPRLAGWAIAVIPVAAMICACLRDFSTGF